MRLRARSSIHSGVMLTAPGRCDIAYAIGESASTSTKSAPLSISRRRLSRSIGVTATDGGLPAEERPAADARAPPKVVPTRRDLAPARPPAPPPEPRARLGGSG